MNKYLIMLAEQSWTKTILFALVACGIYYMALFDDGHALQAGYTQAKQQLAEAEKSLKATKEAIANADKFEREVKDAIENFNRVIDFMPDKFNIADMTTITSELSTRAGTHLMKTEPRETTNKVEFYDTTRLAFSLEGTFSQVLMFLSYLSRVPKLMTFDKVDLEVSSQSTEVENPRLQFSATLVGYKYIKPKLVDDKGSLSDPANPAAGAAPGAAPGAAAPGGAK